MKNIIKLYKPPSTTPLELINQFKADNPKYKHIKMTYAGRLDPMAEGLMLILTAEECKNKQQYLNLDKTYIVDILWGVETDSYDILGEIIKTRTGNPFTQINSERLGRHPNLPQTSKITHPIFLNQFQTTFNQPYPIYSSKTVNGKPLWLWAKQNKLDQIPIPTKKVTIHSIKHIKNYNLKSNILQNDIIQKISKLNGDFRQQSIITSWNSFFNKSNKDFQVTQIEVKCSSGTYMRSLAHNIGQKLNTLAIAYNIKRTKIGKYKLEEN